MNTNLDDQTHLRCHIIKFMTRRINYLIKSDWSIQHLIIKHMNNGI